MSDEGDYYARLGIAPTASPDEISQAWRSASFRSHPDRNRDDPVAAHAEFVALGEAYVVLSDPTSRSRYDRYWQSRFGRGEDVAAPHRRETTSTWDEVLNQATRPRPDAPAEKGAWGFHAPTHHQMAVLILKRPPVTLGVWLVYAFVAGLLGASGYLIFLTCATADVGRTISTLAGLPLLSAAVLLFVRGTTRWWGDRRVLRRCRQAANAVQEKAAASR